MFIVDESLVVRETRKFLLEEMKAAGVAPVACSRRLSESQPQKPGSALPARRVDIDTEWRTALDLLVDENSRVVWLVYSRPVDIVRFSPSLRSGTI